MTYFSLPRRRSDPPPRGSFGFPAGLRRRALVWLMLPAALAATSPARAGIQDGLIAWYPFDGDVLDASGNGNDGFPTGGPAYVTGHSGSAVLLDGIDDVVVLPGDLWTTSFTTAFWVRTTAIAPPGVWWYEGLGVVDGEVCGSPPGGDFGIAMINGGRVIVSDRISSAPINDGNYHVVIVTRSAVTDSVKLYLDGQPDFAFQMIPVELTGMPWIGVGNNPCDSSLNRRFFPGEIDELRFYDRILDAGEIAELSGITVGAPVSPAPIPILSVFPNPMRGATTLSLVLPSAGDASVRVYDLRGALVRTVASGPLPAGARTIRWSGDDGSGLPVPAGVYLIRLESGGTAAARKVVVLE